MLDLSTLQQPTDIKYKPLVIDAEEKKRCEDSLHEFVKWAWPIIEPYEYQDGKHVHALCLHLQEMFVGKLNQLIINIFPRSTKTTIFNVMFPVWCWIHSPGETFLCFSPSQDMADKGATDSRNIIESELFQKHWGHKFKLSDDQNAKRRYTNDQNGFRTSTTFESKVVGRGARWVVCDDPCSPDDSDSQLQKIIDIFKGVISNRVNDPRASKMILGMQRIGSGDLTAHILKTNPKEWAHLSLPIEYDPTRACKTVPLPGTNGKPWEDWRTEPGELLWPERFDQGWVARKKISLGSRIFSCQYNQSPSDDSGGIFLRKHWRPITNYEIKEDGKEAYIAYEIMGRTEKKKIAHIYQSYDCAFSDKDTSDYSCCITSALCESYISMPTFEGIAKQKINELVILSVWYERVNVNELLERALRLKRNWTDIQPGNNPPSWTTESNYIKQTIIIEEAASGIILRQQLKDIGIIAKPFVPRASKEYRASLAAPTLECGLVFGLAEKKNGEFKFKNNIDFLVNQAEVFPNGGPHSRDLVDAYVQTILYAKNDGKIRNVNNFSTAKDGIKEKKNLPAYTEPTSEPLNEQLRRWQAKAEKLGQLKQKDPFGYIHRNANQTYADFKENNMGDVDEDVRAELSGAQYEEKYPNDQKFTNSIQFNQRKTWQQKESDDIISERVRVAEYEKNKKEQAKQENHLRRAVSNQIKGANLHKSVGE